MKMEKRQPKNSFKNTAGPKKPGPLRRFRTPKSARGKPNLEAFYFWVLEAEKVWQFLL
jgi:hypothetical protein